MEIIRGIIPKAERVVIYGPEGIGKTTFASRFPDPLFIDTEGSTSDIDVARLPAPSSWANLVQEVNFIRNDPTICKTLVIDTADWAERFCKNMICSNHQKKGIEDFGYGKGYVYLAEEFGKFLNALTDITEKGIHVVVTAHAQMRKFEQPNETGAYDRWELKLEKKTAPLLKEWSTMLLFANYKVMVVKDENDKARARGGQRVLFTSHHASWDAKNRKNMPEELPFNYNSIAKYISKPKNNTQESVEAPVSTADQEELPETIPEKSPQQEVGLLDQLQDLMREKMIELPELMNVVEAKGYYPAGTPIENYDPQFIKGVLIGAWEQVEAMIIEKRDKDMPF